MPPEIVQNYVYKEKVDVWSFGCFAYQLATGNPPFSDMHSVSARTREICDLSKSVPSIGGRWSDNFKDFVSCCLTKDPEKRLAIHDLLYKHPFLSEIKEENVAALREEWKSDYRKYTTWKDA